MTGIVESVEALVGKTPMLRLTRYAEMLRLGTTPVAKLEYLNPAGSVKDRVGWAMIRDAEARGLLTQGMVIIEPTSGNTGIGLASAAAVLGYRIILTMPETMSTERRQLLAAYGAELVLTDGAEGMKGAIKKAEELAAALTGAYIPGQFTNFANPDAHRRSTGPEIWADTEGRVDVLVSGVGTGGTISGVGEYLKSRSANIRVVAVEPEDSPVLSGGQAGAHGLQGIGAGFIPESLTLGVIDEVIRVGLEDAYQAGREVARTEGLLIGVSSGAAVWAAAQLAARPEYTEKMIAVILPDSGERYLSTPMFSGQGLPHVG